MALSLAEATEHGLSRHVLRGKKWERIGSKVYRRAGAPENRWQLLTVWQGTLPPGTVFSGTTAAWVHGLDCFPPTPVHVIVAPNSGTRSRRGVIARRCSLQFAETLVVRGLLVTNLRRTLLDLCIQLPLVEALVGFDAAFRWRKISRLDLAEYAAEVAGRAGSARLRHLVSIAEPAESPKETQLRWLFLEEGLGRPEVQKNLYDERGHLVCRADLYYASARLVIEFDGGNHRERLVSDNRRQNLISNAGYQILRFTSADLRDRPKVIVAQVRRALAAPRHRV